MKSHLETIDDVVMELVSAIEAWPPFNTPHEGYAILLEEVDELWDEVKASQKSGDLDKVYDEAKQVAAMAIRIMLDVC